MECLKINIDPEKDEYFCDHCKTGRMPLYGEVVWVKYGTYRWWPAQVIHTSEVPPNIEKMSHEVGEFPIQFCGSHEYLWMNHGRCFFYDEGDVDKFTALKATTSGKDNAAYKRGLIEAAELFQKYTQVRKLSLDEVKAKLAKIGTDIIVSSDEVHEGGSSNNENGVHNGSSNGIINISAATTNGHQHHIIPWSSSPHPGGEYFNFDIICPHGNLCIAESKRKLVTAEVWQKLSSYFTHPRMFTENESLCPSCIANDDKARLAIEAKKEIANQQKNLLSDILNERNRPTWARSSLNRVYIIPRK